MPRFDAMFLPITAATLSDSAQLQGNFTFQEAAEIEAS